MTDRWSAGRYGSRPARSARLHEWMRPLTAMINMYVPDCDTLYPQALRAGAKSLSPVAVQPYGARAGAVEDDWGNQWVIATLL